MKQLIIFSISLLISLNSFAQPKVHFEKQEETIEAISKKLTSYTFSLKATPQPEFDGYSVEFILLESDFSISKDNIFIPTDRTFTISGTKEVTKKFTIQFKDDKIDIKTIKLGLKGAPTHNGIAVQLAPSFTTHIVKIKNKDGALAEKEGYEFWLHTGTNIDLLDGVKPKDLFFRGSYLINIKKNEDKTKVPSRSWWYINFGKNRYFTDKDTLTRRGFTDIIPESRSDSMIRVINGRYNANLQTETNNIYFAFNYLYNIDKYSTERSKLLAGAGMYVGLQKIEIKYQDVNIYFRDTSLIPFQPNFGYRPIPLVFDREELNTNFNVSIFHILNTSKVNVKTQLISGIHFRSYPFATAQERDSNVEFYETNNPSPFVQARIEATVLNPGLSIGFEGFLRKGSVPLFNASLTKVFDLQNLKSIFSPVKTANLSQ